MYSRERHSIKICNLPTLNEPRCAKNVSSKPTLHRWDSLRTRVLVAREYVVQAASIAELPGDKVHEELRRVFEGEVQG